MSWLELKLSITRDQADALELLLWAAGAVSVTLTDAEDDPLYEPGVGETPLWRNLVLTGLFEGAADAESLQLALAQAWQPHPLPPMQFNILADQDWERKWLDDFKPMRFGKRLWVCPSWSSQESRDDGRIVVQLDPGLAFGTGTHPTTSLCLQWLDSQDLQGQRLLDFGCGSGILGIAALLLGAASVLGVDNDPQALTATRDNCRKNALPETRFPVLTPEALDILQKSEAFQSVDGVMANILAGTLIDLAQRLAALVRPSGWLLLSGILCGQGGSVQDAFSPWFEGFDEARDGDWIRLSCRKR